MNFDTHIVSDREPNTVGPESKLSGAKSVLNEEEMLLVLKNSSVSDLISFKLHEDRNRKLLTLDELRDKTAKASA